MVIKKIDSTALKLKELMKAVKEAGGNLDTQMKAQETLKNYFKKSAQEK